MRSNKDNGELPVTLADRVATAFCSTFVAAIMLMIVPLPLALRGGLSLYYYYDRFLIWCAVVMALTATTGFLLGAERMTDLFGHLWNTAEPERPYVSVLLWLVILGCAVITYILVPSTMP